VKTTIRGKSFGFVPTTIGIEGDENICMWYLPTVKSFAADFIKECRKAGLNQNRRTFTFGGPFARAYLIYHYGLLKIRITSIDEHAKKEKKKEEEFCNLIVLCGDEEVGYNVAVFSEGGGNSYLRFATMSDVMAMFPVAEHQQAHKYRYSYVSDVGDAVATEAEPIIQAYSKNGAVGQGYNIFSTPPSDPETPGPRCLPTGFELGSPYDSTLFTPLAPARTCGSPSNDIAQSLVRFGYTGVQTRWDMLYAPRVFVLNQVGGRTEMFDKRDVVLSVEGAASITGINTHAWVMRDEFTFSHIKNKSLYVVSFARHGRHYKDRNPFFDPTSYYEFYGQYAGLFMIQKAASPAGPLLVLNDAADGVVSRIWELTESFLQTFPDYLGCGPARFIPELDSDFFREVDAANTAYKSNLISEEVARSYYACTFPNILAVNVTHRAPMTESADEFKGLPVTGMWTGDSNLSGHRASSSCGKNIAQSILLNGILFDVYFSTFLEGTYTYSASTGHWGAVESRQIYIGAAKKTAGGAESKFNVLENLKVAFSEFRRFDLEAERIPPLGPHPCAGAVMFYPFQKGQNYFADELDCFNQINEYRVAMGAPKLKWDGNLNTPAATHADDMILFGPVGGHEGSDYSQSAHRLMASGVTGWCKKISTYGEIIAINCNTAAQAIVVWKASLMGHHEALYTKRHIACGIAVRSSAATGKIWVVTLAGDHTFDIIP
jgi:uncharacterized protein YkwD